MTSDVHFLSRRHDWETPQFLFDGLNAEFRFDVDVCSTPENAKCRRFFTEEDDGLQQEWTGACWMNPPYGRQIARWVEKAFKSSLDGALVVCLVPARTDTQWWHQYVTRASDIRFLRGRLKFGGAENSAPFPSAVVVFRPPLCGQRVLITTPEQQSGQSENETHRSEKTRRKSRDETAPTITTPDLLFPGDSHD